MPEKIFYLYGSVVQDWMKTWNNDESNPKITFVHGLDLSVVDKHSGSKFLVIDDLCLSQNKELTQHFLAGSHHKNITTIYISHSIYINDDNYRMLSNNCQYMLLMNNKRQMASVSRLARSILGKEYLRIVDAYNYNRNKQFGFVLLSFHPKVPEELLVIVDFFEECPSIFI